MTNSDSCTIPTVASYLANSIRDGFDYIYPSLLEKQLDDKPSRYRYKLTTYKVTSEEVQKMRHQHEIETEETMETQEAKRRSLGS